MSVCGCLEALNYSYIAKLVTCLFLWHTIFDEGYIMQIHVDSHMFLERSLCYGNAYMIVWNIAYTAATDIYGAFEFQIWNFERLINEIFCRNVNGMSWCIPNISNM